MPTGLFPFQPYMTWPGCELKRVPKVKGAMTKILQSLPGALDVCGTFYYAFCCQGPYTCTRHWCAMQSQREESTKDYGIQVVYVHDS